MRILAKNTLGYFYLVHTRHMYYNAMFQPALAKSPPHIDTVCADFLLHASGDALMHAGFNFSTVIYMLLAIIPTFAGKEA